MKRFRQQSFIRDREVRRYIVFRTWLTRYMSVTGRAGFVYGVSPASLFNTHNSVRDPNMFKPLPYDGLINHSMT